VLKDSLSFSDYLNVIFIQVKLLYKSVVLLKCIFGVVIIHTYIYNNAYLNHGIFFSHLNRSLLL